MNGESGWTSNMYTQHEQLWGLSPDAWIAVLTACLTLATILLGVFTYFLWRSTRAAVIDGQKALAHARDSTQHELRAYVSVYPNFIVAFDAERQSGARFKLRNDGRTPAHNVRHVGSVEVIPAVLPPDFALPEISIGDGVALVLFPGAEFTGKCSSRRLFSEQEIAAVRSGHSRVCVYGNVKYNDILNTEREVQFCSSVIADDETLRRLTTAHRENDLAVEFQVGPFAYQST